jgi:hypothetical protein
MSYPSQSFLNKLNQVFLTDILSISEKISIKFDLDFNDVKEYVESLLSDKEEKPVVKQTKKIIDTEEEPVETKKKVEKTVNQNAGKTCQHMMTSGKNKGNQCGDKVHAESKTGLYCKTHLKNESGNKFIQASLPFNEKKEEEKKVEEKKVNKKIAADKPLINNSAEIKNIIAERTNTISIKKNKTWGVYEHSGSGLVLDPETKEVIGKLNNDTGVVSDLTTEDIDLAKTLGFKKIKIPDNLPSSKKSIKSELYDDEDDEDDDISDVEDDGDDE